MYSVDEIRKLILTGNKKKIYDDKDWKILSKKALERDGYECQECKKEGRLTIKQHKRKLDVHHIKEIEKYPELTYILSNLETVCVMHHNILDGKITMNKRKKEYFINEERW